MLAYLYDLIDAHPTGRLMRVPDEVMLEVGPGPLGAVALEAWAHEYGELLDAAGLLLVRFRT
jgi:hypothetical protein